MDRIRIVGGNRLNGTIPISGAKNAALPLMIASLLTRRAADARKRAAISPTSNLLIRILGNHGVDYAVDGKRNGGSPLRPDRPSRGWRYRRHDRALRARLADARELLGRSRRCVARMGEAKVSLPGGCAIGTRPVDLLLMALEKLGASDRDRGGLCDRQGAERACMAPRSSSRK